MRRLLPIILTGLGTTPVSEADQTGDQPEADCGMLGIAEELRATLPEFEVLDAIAFSWNGGRNAELVAGINGAIAFERLGKGDAVVIQAHSFGNNPAVDWAEENAPIDPTVICIGHDPCREYRKYFGAIRDWKLGPVVNAALVHYQQKGRPAMVSGTPFAPRDNQVQIDVSGWDKPTLAHVDCSTIEGFPPRILHNKGIIMDARVREAIHATVRGVLLEGKSVREVIEGLSAAYRAGHAGVLS